MHSTHRIQDLPYLLAGKHRRETLRLLGTHGVQGSDKWLLQHFRVQKQQRAERLVLGRCGDVLLYSQVGEKGFDLNDTHLLGMALVVKEDVARNPGHVGFFGAQ